MAPNPITCHVLDTLSGEPAANLKVCLTLQNHERVFPLYQPYNVSFHATTDDDGRVKTWTARAEKDPSVQHVVEEYDLNGKTTWSLKFDVGRWYGEKNIECFWPEIEVKFFVDRERGHYHVPVLVGPWTYTTYRGS
jgi:5-hydroxyisourate hydrolase